MAGVKTLVAPFGITADTGRNQNLLIQCIPGLRLRGSIDGTKGTIDHKTGDEVIPVDQARHLGSFPRVPGMQLHVNPAELTYEVIDPLCEDTAMCERIERYMRNESILRTDQKIKGVPYRSGKLDPHRMKSLCREMLSLLAAKEAKIAKGTQPLLVEVEELPGRFLLNPGSTVGNTQPVYADEFDDWVIKLSRSGG